MTPLKRNKIKFNDIKPNSYFMSTSGIVYQKINAIESKAYMSSIGTLIKNGLTTSFFRDSNVTLWEVEI